MSSSDPARAHARDAAAPAKGTILLVDDSDALRDSLCFLLGHAGYRTQAAASAEQALERLRHAPDIALLVTDIGLPRADGWSLARDARALHAGLPVIYISGHAGNEWNTHGVAGSVFLRKPFGFDELLGCVARLASARPPHDAAR